MARISAEVIVGPQGRLVVPASIRRELRMEPGQVLLARAEDGRLVLEPREAVVARIRSQFAAATGGQSLAEELIAERREEARREEARLVAAHADADH